MRVRPHRTLRNFETLEKERVCPLQLENERLRALYTSKQRRNTNYYYDYDYDYDDDYYHYWCYYCYCYCHYDCYSYYTQYQTLPYPNRPSCDCPAHLPQ